MSESKRPFFVDARTMLGLVIVVWVALTAYFLFGPTTSPNRKGGMMATVEAGETKPSDKGKLPVAVIETTEGTIKVRLFTDKAPKTAENFIDLVNKHFYDGIIFHRVIKDFMLQTGDPTGTGRGGRTEKGLPAKHLKDEFHPDLRHDKPGILSMANAGPNTGDTQFFITTVPTKWLDDKHAVFGEVISGMDVVTKIENTPKGRNDRPLDPPKMVKVYMEDQSAKPADPGAKK